MPYVDPSEARNSLRVDLAAEIAMRGSGPWRLPLIGDPAARAVLIGWPPGFATIPHLHPYALETFQVIAGRLGFRLDDLPEEDAGPGTCLLARAGEIHGLRVLGDAPLVILTCVAPNLALPDEAVDRPDAWPDWAPDAGPNWAPATGHPPDTGR